MENLFEYSNGATSQKITLAEFSENKKISRDLLHRRMQEKLWDERDTEMLAIYEVKTNYKGAKLTYKNPGFIRNQDILFIATEVFADDVYPDIKMPFNYALKSKYGMDSLRYQIIMHGSLFDGKSAQVTIRNVPCWFDVLAPPDTDPEIFQDSLGAMFDEKFRHKPTISLNRIENYTAGYSKHPPFSIRIIFTNLLDMREGIKCCEIAGYRLFNDYSKTSGYHRKIFSTFQLNMGEWFVMKNVQLVPFDHDTYNNSILEFEVDLINMKHALASGGPQPHTDISTVLKNPDQAKLVMDVLNLDTYGIDKMKSGNKLLLKDPTALICWDIETHNHKTKEVAFPLNKNGTKNIDAEITMICYTVHWHHSLRSSVNIGFCTREVNIDAYNQHRSDLPAIIVQCEKEADLLTAHAKMVYRFRPGFLMDFNGSNYDWPWIIKRCNPQKLHKMYYGMCYSEIKRNQNQNAESVINQIERIPEVKISAALDRKMMYIPSDGYISVDTNIIMEKRYPRNDSIRSNSLAYYLRVEAVEVSKVDLSEGSPLESIRAKGDGYEELRRIVDDYDEEFKKSGKPPPNCRMYDALYYCFYDCISPHRLMHKIDFIRKSRGYCKTTYVSLNDAIYRGDAMKVCNAREWAAECQHAIRGHAVSFSNKAVGKLSEKFGGGFVPRPILGLHADLPIAALDFTSLYPMIIIVYNLDPTMMIRILDNNGEYLVEETLKLASEIGFENLNEIKFNYCGKSFIFWTRRHQNLDKNGNPDGTYDEKRMGVYPWMLLNFFQNRSKLKKVKLFIGELIEDFNQLTEMFKIGRADLKESGDKKETINTNSSILDGIISEVIGKIMSERAAAATSTFDQEIDSEEISWNSTWNENETISDYLKRKVEYMQKKYNKDFAEGKIIREVHEYMLRFTEQALNPKYSSVSGLEEFVNFLEYVFDSADIEQLTMKVMMNTFYGALGNPHFPVFDLFLAAAVTAMGQKNIKHARELVEKKGCVLMYGDTDSIYIAKNPEFYKELLEKRNNVQKPRQEWIAKSMDNLISGEMNEQEAKLHMESSPGYRQIMGEILTARYEYYHEAISITIVEMKKLQKYVNESFAKLHGCKHLVMALEEITCPTIFTGKKRYSGLKHENMPVLNVRLGKLGVKKIQKIILIRGLDLIKQGHAELTIESSLRMLSELLDPFSYSNCMGYQPLDVVMNELRRVNFETNWEDYTQFVLSARYKPDKKNVCVQEYVHKLKQRNDPETPEGGDRFKYVVVKRHNKYNIYGKKTAERLSGKMEPLLLAQRQNMEIDKEYYISRKLINTMKLLIMYHFEDDEIKKIEDDKVWYKSVEKKAKSFIKEKMKAFEIAGDNSKEAPKFFRSLREEDNPIVQRIYQSLYTRVKLGRPVVNEQSLIKMCRKTPDEIYRLIPLDYQTDKIDESDDPEVKISELRDKCQENKSELASILDHVQKAYDYVENQIYDSRKVAKKNIEYPEDILIALDKYISLVDDLGSCKKLISRYVALINYRHNYI